MGQIDLLVANLPCIRSEGAIIFNDPRLGKLTMHAGKITASAGDVICELDGLVEIVTSYNSKRKRARNSINETGKSLYSLCEESRIW